MKADFTRNTFDPTRQFSRVLMQQGRVQLDADWNEQAAILLHYLQTLAADLIGPHGGPDGNLGFAVTRESASNNDPDLGIGPGHYYVDGILCRNESAARYLTQPYSPGSPALPSPSYVVYLDVWERLVTSVEDDRIREVALGGADTAARAQVVWQVKVTNETADGNKIPDSLDQGEEGDWQSWVEEKWQAWVDLWQSQNRGRLKARTRDAGIGSDDACITPPDARYRGAENQLYRVEIHQGGVNNATFKWSRDNGSVVFPIRSLGGKVATVEGLGRDGRAGLQPGDWVEIVDDGYALRGQPGPLLTVHAVDPIAMTVTLSDNAGVAYDQASQAHPLLRRWDGVGNVREEDEESESWLSLEDGIQIQFQALPSKTDRHTYRSGDYWLIPARTATGDVEWPGPPDQPEALPPHGVEHHYAPLALVPVSGEVQSLRYQFKPME